MGLIYICRMKEEKIVINAKAIEGILVEVKEEQIVSEFLMKQPDTVVVLWISEFIQGLDQKTPDEANTRPFSRLEWSNQASENPGLSLFHHTLGENPDSLRIL